MIVMKIPEVLPAARYWAKCKSCVLIATITWLSIVCIGYSLLTVEAKNNSEHLKLNKILIRDFQNGVENTQCDDYYSMNCLKKCNAQICELQAVQNI